MDNENPYGTDTAEAPADSNQGDTYGAGADNSGDANIGGNNHPVAVAMSVPLVPQPTDVSCWAASLTMVVSARDSASYAVQDVAAAAGMDTTTGYGWSNIQNAVGVWGLQQEGPVCAYPSWWADLLSSKGPLWIVEVGSPYHAVVLTGIHGDGTAEGTNVTLNNPWPPNQGKVETKTFMDFDNDFGLGAGARAMIVHP